MQPHRHDITIIQGDTFEMPFAFDAPDGSVIDPTTEGDGYTVAWMHVRDTVNGDLQVKATTANGRIELGTATVYGASWSGYVRIPASVTVGLTDWGDGGYEIKFSDGLHVYTGPFGTAVLSPSHGPEEDTP